MTSVTPSQHLYDIYIYVRDAGDLAGEYQLHLERVNFETAVTQLTAYHNQDRKVYDYMLSVYPRFDAKILNKAFVYDRHDRQIGVIILTGHKPR